jgi:DnaJ family protein C protein 28
MPSIEDHIRKAMEEGKFEDLPGKGQPLQLGQDNPHEDPSWRLAHHVLRSGGFSLPWLETRKEIETELKEARLVLRRTWEWKNSATAEKTNPAVVEAEWQRVVAAFRRRIEKLNQTIAKYNLEAPSAQFHLLAINVEGEILGIQQK